MLFLYNYTIIDNFFKLYYQIKFDINNFCFLFKNLNNKIKHKKESENFILTSIFYLFNNNKL